MILENHVFTVNLNLEILASFFLCATLKKSGVHGLGTITRLLKSHAILVCSKSYSLLVPRFSFSFYHFFTHVIEYNKDNICMCEKERVSLGMRLRILIHSWSDTQQQHIKAERVQYWCMCIGGLVQHLYLVWVDNE